MSLEFSHGWTSNGSIFRVEAITNISEDSIYTFSIDGQPFKDFPFKDEARRISQGDDSSGKYVGRYGSEPVGAGSVSFSSTGAATRRGSGNSSDGFQFRRPGATTTSEPQPPRSAFDMQVCIHHRPNCPPI